MTGPEADGAWDRAEAGTLDFATCGAALRTMTDVFRRAGLDSPGLDARRLVGWVLCLDLARMLAAPERRTSPQELRSLEAAVRRRLRHEPVSRITGKRTFYGLELAISSATLDPRPETETLVDAALELLAARAKFASGPQSVVDVGTGSGAILIAILTQRPTVMGLGLDVSRDALAIAAANARCHGLCPRAAFERSNWLEAVEFPCDLIVSNPPYIPRADLASLDQDVRCYDPALALDGGLDGLDAYRALAAGAPERLYPGGWLLVEVGAGQAEDVARLFQLAFEQATTQARSGVVVRTWADLSGIERCVGVQMPSDSQAG